MKALKIFGLILLSAVVLFAAAVFIFIKTFDIGRYKDRITQEVGRAIGRDVSLGGIALEVTPTRGLAINLENFEISNDPHFSDRPFLHVDQLHLQLDMEAFLKERKIVVAQVEVVAPNVLLVRDAQGNLNTPMPQGQNGEGAGDKTVAPSAGGSPPRSGQGDVPTRQEKRPLPELAVDLCRLKNGTITWVDRLQDPPRSISVEKLDMTAEQFSLTGPFPVRVDAAFLSGRPDVHVQVKAQIFPMESRVLLSGGTITADLSLMDLARLQAAFPEIKAAGFRKPFSGEITVALDRLEAGPEGLKSMAAKGQLKGGQADPSFLPVPVKDIAADLEATESGLRVSDFSAGLSTGTVSGNASVDHYLAAPETAVDITLRQLPMRDLLPVFDNDVRFTGACNGEARLRFSGFESDGIIRSLAGPVRLRIDDGRLENLNILKVILQRISVIPGLYDKIYENLPSRYKDRLKTDTTVFEKINATLTAGNGVITLTASEVTADVFSLQAEGSMDEGRNIDLGAKLYIPQDLSQSMIASVPELQGIASGDGRLTIPFQRYQGPASSFQIMPDLSYLTKRILVNRGAQEIDKLLDKVFPAEEAPAPQEGQQGASQGIATPEGEGQDASSAPKKSPERQMIENILDSILK